MATRFKTYWRETLWVCSKKLPIPEFGPDIDGVVRLVRMIQLVGAVRPPSQAIALGTLNHYDSVFAAEQPRRGVLCNAAQRSLDESGRMADGTIKRLTDKGFGFIDTGGSKDLFFHSSSVVGVGYDDLQEGQSVSFTEGRGPKGPCAENVKPV